MCIDNWTARSLILRPSPKKTPKPSRLPWRRLWPHQRAVSHRPTRRPPSAGGASASFRGAGERAAMIDAAGWAADKRSESVPRRRETQVGSTAGGVTGHPADGTRRDHCREYRHRRWEMGQGGIQGLVLGSGRGVWWTLVILISGQFRSDSGRRIGGGALAWEVGGADKTAPNLSWKWRASKMLSRRPLM